MNEDIQFAKIKDFNADTRKRFINAEAEKDAEKTMEGFSENTNLLIEGIFNPSFKIKKITPITPDFVRNTLSI